MSTGEGTPPATEPFLDPQAMWSIPDGSKLARAVHVLKTKSAYFDAIARGDKTFDVRPNDRGFQALDLLRLVRHDESSDCADPDCQRGACRPDTLNRVVTYVYSGDPSLRANGGLTPGFVVLGLGADRTGL